VSADKNPDPRTETEIESEAAAWIIHMEGEPTAEERARFDAWRRADPRHDTACRRLETVWSRAGLLTRVPPEGAPVDADLLKPRGSWWRPASILEWLSAPHPVVRRVIAFLLPVTIVAAVAWFSLLPRLGVAYDNTTVYSARHWLEDGSQVELRPSSHIRARMTTAARIVDFESGEVRFAVAKDPDHRPFDVRVGNTVLRAKGTNFWVRSQDADRVEMDVVEGSVLVEIVGQEGPTLIAGERVTVRGTDALVLPSSDHRITLRRTPLAEAVRDFNWYYPDKMIVADESLRDFVLTGSFRAVNRAGFLESLMDQGIRSEEGSHEIVLRR
jgi:transmembrane sensor